MSNKLIKDCLECMEEVQKYLNKCGDWEVKKKEVLEKVKNKVCDASPAKNKPHSAVISQEVDKHVMEGWTGNNAGEAQHCHKCNISWSWQTNGFGDFQWEGSYCEHSEPQNKEWLAQQGIIIPKVSEVSQIQQSQSSHSTQNKSISNNNSSIQREREREREREQQWQLQI